MVPAAKYQKLAKVYAEVKAPVNAAVRSSTHHTLLCREAPGCSSWDSFGPLRLTAHFDYPRPPHPPRRPPSCSSSRRTRCSRARCRISQARTTSCRPSSVRSRAAANRLRCRSAPPQPVLASIPPAPLPLTLSSMRSTMRVLARLRTVAFITHVQHVHNLLHSCSRRSMSNATTGGAARA